MIRKNRILCVTACLCAVAFLTAAKAEKTIPAGSKVHIAAMDGFETYVKAALEKKGVPVTVVENKEDAAYEISGVAESQKAGAAKKILMGSWHSKETASVQVADLKTGVVVFAYSYHAENSTHGKRSAAEACAKHIKDAIKKQ